MRQKKFKQHRLAKFLSKWIFIFLVLAVAGKFLWNILLNLEQLGLNPDSITIEGNSMVSDNRILGVLDLKYGQNILKIKTKELTEKLQALVRINMVSIKRDFPDSLKINVEEVKPVGYLIKNNIRYVITCDGIIFPGLEGPAIEFKVSDTETIKKLAILLLKIDRVNSKFYNSIIAVDCNYRDEVIICRHDCYVKLPAVSEIDEAVIKRSIYLLDEVVKQYKKESQNISYIDLRFVDFDNGKIKGAVIVK